MQDKLPIYTRITMCARSKKKLNNKNRNDFLLLAVHLFVYFHFYFIFLISAHFYGSLPHFLSLHSTISFFMAAHVCLPRKPFGSSLEDTNDIWVKISKIKRNHFVQILYIPTAHRLRSQIYRPHGICVWTCKWEMVYWRGKEMKKIK